MKKSFILAAIAVLGLASCGTNGNSSEERSATLLQADSIHNVCIQLGDQAKSILVDLSKEYGSLQEQYQAAGDSLALESANIMLEKIGHMKNYYNEWSEGLAEVPGMACNHEGHDHDHAHDHATENTTSKLTDDENLAIQMEQKKVIEGILNDLQSLKQK
ncbi:MAG: hypothetical protein RL226_1385 [Bacteroidota bacterium]|jgi:hypothetical protein